ncbi:MAG: glutamate racemase [Actinomycetota bacterium]|nr:glutamate racemase [Actinomycetota bacterium]
MDSRPIGIFDSGLGGLSIVRALVDLLPDEQLIYFGDTARFPYGEKSADELRRFALEITTWLLGHVKMVVVACNSATSAALDTLRNTFAMPILGVIEPGVRAALQVTAGRLGVIGTQATISSGAYERAVATAGRGGGPGGRADIRAGVALTTLACPGFVELVEAGDVSSPLAYDLVHETLAPLYTAGIDTLVLGCTHYPYLARIIGEVMGRDVVLVSSGEETAFEVRHILEETGTVRGPGGGPASRTFLTSGDETTFTLLGRRFLGPDFGPVRTWSSARARSGGP